MKTKNNVQKTILKSLAVATSFILISFTVNAQDFWKSLFNYSGLNQIVLAMTDNEANVVAGTTELPTEGESTITYFEAESEAPLEVENWMTDETLFKPTISIEEETELPLELEDWMTNENSFEMNVFQVETEQSLEVENWMLNEHNFKTSLFAEKRTETKLELESWMTESANWK